MKNKYLILLLLLFSACVKEPKFEKVNNFEIKNYNSGIIEALMNISIRNENAVGLKVDTFDYKLIYSETEIAKGVSTESFDLKANDISAVKLNIDVNVTSLKPFFSDFLNRDSVQLYVKLRGRASKIKLPFFYSFTTYINSKQLFDKLIPTESLKNIFSITGIKVKSVTMAHTNIETSILFHNPFPLDYTIKALQFDVLDASNTENKVAEIQQNIQKSVKADDNAQLVVDFSVNNGNMASSVFSQIFGEQHKPNYLFSGKVKIAFKTMEFEVPVNYKFE